MRIIKLDGEQMCSVREAHAHIARELGFPEYYGGNLDALWDELTVISEPCHIQIRHVNNMHNQLGEYAARLIHTFLEASEANEYCQVELGE